MKRFNAQEIVEPICMMLKDDNQSVLHSNWKITNYNKTSDFSSFKFQKQTRMRNFKKFFYLAYSQKNKVGEEFQRWSDDQEMKIPLLLWNHKKKK